jgi:tripartite-type tricarboxylate transporter receptor subunit TctC
VRLICIALFAAPALLVLPSAFSHPAAAQEWPIRTVKVIVPYTPGGATDTMARVVADRASKILGQPFIIDNRPGAGGAIGTEAAVHAPKDGYTFYVASATQVAVLPLMQKLSYDPRKDLTPISIVGENPMGLAVTPRLAVRSVRELIDYARANPGKLNYRVDGSSHRRSGPVFRQHVGFRRAGEGRERAAPRDLLRETQSGISRHTHHQRDKSRLLVGKLEWPVCANRHAFRHRRSHGETRS